MKKQFSYYLLAGILSLFALQGNSQSDGIPHIHDQNCGFYNTPSSCFVLNREKLKVDFAAKGRAPSTLGATMPSGYTTDSYGKMCWSYTLGVGCPKLCTENVTQNKFYLHG